MIQVEKIAVWREIRAALHTKKIGFVPTMGFLHEGHLSLIKQAKKENEIVVLSIFVNPLQFGENEDYHIYPRDLLRDAQLAKEAGVDYLFAPNQEEMYPSPIRTTVTVQGVSEGLCGQSRPGHFTGVATVVCKLFQIIQPTQSYFGLKDAQQVAVLTQMVNDLNIPVEIKSCPIIREVDGLALSSRNIYLTENERIEATILFHSLQYAEQLILAGERDVQEIKQKLIAKIQSKPLARIDYVEVRRFPSLEEIRTIETEQEIIIALAVKFGQTRLIDNKLLVIPTDN